MNQEQAQASARFSHVTAQRQDTPPGIVEITLGIGVTRTEPHGMQPVVHEGAQWGGPASYKAIPAAQIRVRAGIIGWPQTTQEIPLAIDYVHLILHLNAASRQGKHLADASTLRVSIELLEGQILLDQWEGFASSSGKS